MSEIFQNRFYSNYGKAIVKYTLADPQTDPIAKMLYFMALRPSQHHPRFAKDPAWIAFLESKEVSEDASYNEMAETAALALAEKVISDDIIEALAEDVRAKISAVPGFFECIRVVAPLPIIPEGSTNPFAPALAAAVTEALARKLESSLPILSDMDREEFGEYGLLNIINNQRSKTSTPPKGDERNIYIQRLVRQPVFTGKTEDRTLYVPVDDAMVAGSTIGSLINYIQSRGGTATWPVVAIQMFKGNETIQPQQASLDYLEAVIAEVCTVNDLNILLRRVGLFVDLKSPVNTCLTNIEVMFLAGFFADPTNAEHRAKFDAAIAAIGAPFEQVKKFSTYEIFEATPGMLSDLEAAFDKTMEHRIPLTKVRNVRVQQLLESGKLVGYNGGKLC